MAEGAKKSRLESVFEKFNTSTDIKESFTTACSQLLGHHSSSLISYKITYCDADAEDGKTFSKATCHAKPVVEELYPFGSIFERGVSILTDLVGKNGYIPEDDETKALLAPLLTYLFDNESHECLRKLKDSTKNETQLMITLAGHFFSKLSASKGFKMDKYAPNKNSICTCKNCVKKDFQPLFGDTSIGHKEVWHGSLDIILDSSEVGASVTHEVDDSPGERKSVEVKFEELRSVVVRDQALAQTITFSFLQQQRHPAMKHFLIPYILASTRAVQLFFYDSKNDILLLSPELEYFMSDNVELYYATIIASWLVLNYKYLCSGPTKNMIAGPKADFQKQVAGSALEIYESQLLFGNVTDTVKELQDPWKDIQKGQYKALRFQWPDEPFPRLYKPFP